VHHVTARGNHKLPLFNRNLDRETYQRMIQKYFAQSSLLLLGYCWMTNHVHQADIPGHVESLADGIRPAHGEYARWFQMQQCTSGHLFGERFYSCVVEDPRVLQTMLYMELNPVRAGLVKRAWDWPWSSARAHITGIDDSGLLDLTAWRRRIDLEAWREMLEKAVKDEQFYQEIRAATRRGRPLGSDEFITRLEQQLGRVLRPRPGGRPKKCPEQAGNLEIPNVNGLLIIDP
jgi:putative transposase